MAKKKQPEKKNFNNPNVMGLRAEVLEQPITETLETNYMPYATRSTASSPPTASSSTPC